MVRFDSEAAKSSSLSASSLTGGWDLTIEEGLFDGLKPRVLTLGSVWARPGMDGRSTFMGSGVSWCGLREGAWACGCLELLGILDGGWRR